MTTTTGSANGRMSQCSLQAGHSMNFAKTLQVQDQIIEQLRTDQAALREALEVERNALKECRLTSDRELKAMQREKVQVSKINRQQELKIEELEKELAYTREALAFEQKNLKALEKEHVTTVKELKIRTSKDFEKTSKQEMLIDQLKSEIEDLKEALQSERNATNLLIREHNAEVKMLREEVRTKSTEAYRELKERATREREEYREMQEEAERTYKILEKDFRDALNAKDEELRRAKAEAKLIQKELEDQLRASLKEPAPVQTPAPFTTNDFVEMAKFRRMKNEVAILKEQNRKLLNELQVLTGEKRINEIGKGEEYTIPPGDLEGVKQKSLDKVSDFEITRLNDGSTATGPKTKPAVPKKPVVATVESDVSRTIHVRDMVRKLQAKEPTIEIIKKVNFVRPAFNKGQQTREIILKEEMGGQMSKQTLEDLKAIDEDLEKLRKQIEERDKIISALREAAEAKDKKLENLMMEYSKLQSNGKMDLDASPEPNRATSSSPSSPPLCDGELCWTDSFVNKNYHEPVYAQLLNDHTALQKIYNELRTKLESKGKEEDANISKSDEGNKIEGQENGINLIMAEQIRILKEREAQLISEAEELREQNDLMEFRILELEECRKEFLDKEVANEGKHRGEKIVWAERDLEDISDSGVMSLPTSEDLTSDSELGDGIRNYSPLGAVTNLNLLTTEASPVEGSGVGSDLKIKKPFKFSECLQESGIFEDSEPSSDCAISPTSSSSPRLSKAVQTESGVDKTLYDLIDSSCDLLLTKNRGYLEDKSGDDLSAELSKLTVIQKRIQQKTSSSPTPRGPHTVHTCPHKNSLIFYEERLNQLEDKLKIYESTGDTKDSLLAKRLEKEVELAYRVKELTDKVSNLEAVKRRLEEEKCEFEEAENDTRFQCQRLEIRLQELIDKNTELELELERQKVIMTEERRRERKKGSLEGLISRYEQRNFELEEKEIEARQRLSMMESAMPAIVAWNVFQMMQNPNFANILPEGQKEKYLFPNEKKLQYPDGVVFQRLEELVDDQKKLRRDYKKVEESAADREKALRDKIEELEAKAAKDREMLEEMTNALKTFKTEEKSGGERESGSVNSIRAEDVDLFEELKQMVANEIQLRAEIERLEKKEQAYMQSLEKADEIWAGMEEDYKRRLKEAETMSNELQKRVSQLEATQVELEKALKAGDESYSSASTKSDVKLKIEELINENEKLKAEINHSLDRKFEEHRKFLEAENSSLREEVKKLKTDFDKREKNFRLLEKEVEMAKEEVTKERETTRRLRLELEEKNRSVTTMEVTLQNQISDLTLELSQKSKELSSLEDKVAELVDTIQNSVYNQDDGGKKASAVELSLPVGKSIGHVVSLSLGDSKREMGLEEERRVEVGVVNSEVVIMKETPLPSLQVLIPSPYRYRWISYSVPVDTRQKMKFLRPLPLSAEKFFLRRATAEMVTTPESVEDFSRQEEIFQLSLKNTELQQILEKVEEESRLKDKELEELQRIAQEIRREQIELASLYEITNSRRRETSAGIKSDERTTEVDEDDLKTRCHDYSEDTADSTEENDVKDRPRRSQSIDVLQIINPIVLNTSDPVSTSLSSLQIVLDNLQNKCRSMNFVKSLLDEPKDKGDGCENEPEVTQKAIEYPGYEETKTEKTEQYDTEKQLESSHWELKPMDYSNQRRPTSPKHLTKSASACYFMVLPSIYPRSIGSKLGEVDPNLNFVAPIRKMRKVGDDGIFLEWDVSRQPEEVTGFEIQVNGCLTHRVRSSTRNKALLHPLDLSDRILIQLFATSEKGRSIRCSHVTCPEHFVHKTESQ